MIRNAISALFILSFSFLLVACNNGDYKANPDNPTNGAINPLNPLTASQFNWSGVTPVSLNINGALWVADSAFYFMDTAGNNTVYAFKDKQALFLYFKDTWQGNVYSMGFHQYSCIGQWLQLDSFYSANSYYQSALGNSGGLYISRNDTVRFAGEFYFHGVNGNGQSVSITNGFFDLKK